MQEPAFLDAKNHYKLQQIFTYILCDFFPASN